MAAAELRQPHRKLTVGDRVGVEYLDVSGTVHRLQRHVSGFEDMVAVMVPMTALMEKALVEELRRAHFLIAGAFEPGSNIVLDHAIENLATRVPEHTPCGVFLKMEEIECAA